MALAPVILHQDMSVTSNNVSLFYHNIAKIGNIRLSHFFATANYYDQAFLKVLPKAKTRQRQRDIFFLSWIALFKQLILSDAY